MHSSTPSESGRRAAAVILVLFVVVFVAILIALFATNRSGGDSHGAHAVDDGGLGHVHGLGVDPEDNTLYIATHTGVFTFADGQLERVADRWQDTMGFAVVGPQHFLASGHPDLREDLPPHLGLIESVDGAETWQPLSLQGEADLHAIEPADDTIFAFDSATGSLIATDDQKQWRTVDRRPLVDLAALSTPEGHQLLATTPSGQLLQYDPVSQQPSQIADAPVLTYLDWEGPGALVGAGPSGDMFTSASGQTWQRVGAVTGEVVALNATANAWHAATDDGVFVSTDQGQSWTLVVEVA